MAVMVEKGRLVELEELKRIRDKEFREAQDKDSRKKLCKELGLKKQAQLGFDTDIDIGTLYRELKGSERRMWECYLPTKYSKKSGEWKDYQFDRVSVEVLEEISFAHSLRIFDDLEIWTPEENTDPICVGVLDNPYRIFLISRWSESLKSVAEIMREVVFQKNQWYHACEHIDDGRIIRTKLPKPVADFIVSFMGQDLENRKLKIWSGFTFSIHCKRPMYKLILTGNNSRQVVKICPVCGHNS